MNNSQRLVPGDQQVIKATDKVDMCKFPRQGVDRITNVKS